MTALETWCLAMIGLVFEALLAYVVVLFWLFRERALQAKTRIFRKIDNVSPFLVMNHDS